MAPIFLLDYCPYDHEEAETLRGKGAAWPRPRVSSQQGGGGNRPRRAWAREAAAAQPRASARTRGRCCQRPPHLCPRISALRTSHGHSL